MIYRGFRKLCSMFIQKPAFVLMAVFDCRFTVYLQEEPETWLIIEPPHKKTSNLYMQKQRRRSASQ